MKQLFALICSLLQLLLPMPEAFSSPDARAAFAMRTGVTLRMHVIAHDDTEAMQQIKLAVRDGVQAAYRSVTGGRKQPMLPAAQQHLDTLAHAAAESARSAGFTGTVDVSLAMHRFDERTLDGLTIPAGLYPALIVSLGDAQGRNWWGLIDPQFALACAACPAAEADGVIWDWSLDALISALTSLLTPAVKEAVQ